MAAKQEQVRRLEEENATARAEVERLHRSEYLEALARKERGYARPGEQVFVVKGLPLTTTTTAPASSGPGPAQGLVQSVRDLFH